MKKIIVFIAAFCVLCFVINSFYTFPSADDFSYFVGQEKLGFLKFQKWHFLNWGGRYLPNMALGIFSFDGNGLYVYRAFAALIILTLALGFYQLSNAFFEKENAFYIASFLFISYSFSFYSIAQEFYWMPGSVTYTLGITLSLFIWSFIKKLENNLVFIFSLIAVIILNGTNEVTMIFFNISLILFSVFQLLKAEPIAKRVYILISLSIICMAFSILAPGNTVRSLSINNPNTHQLFYTISRALNRSIIFLYEKFFIFFITGFIIYNIVTVKNLKLKISQSFPNIIKILTIIFPFAILCTSVALTYFATGRIPPERTANTIAFYFLIALIFSLMFYKANFTEPNLSSNKVFSPLLHLFFIVLLMFYPNELRANIVDLFTGKSRQFTIEMKERDAFIKSSSAQVIHVKKISVLPITIFFKDISSNPNNFINNSYAAYYHKKSITVNE